MSREQTSERKKDHIKLAFESVIAHSDKRFYYEPMLAGTGEEGKVRGIKIAGKKCHSPIWVSSMTGGTKMAGHINKNLARACAEFGMGMGLGSCRIILDDDQHFEDFNLRPIIGETLPFFANLGIAQVEELIGSKQLDKISNILEKLQADGLIVHVNPMQEFLQPEGDIIHNSPLSIIKELLAQVNYPVIVKEVGQGMGPASLLELMQLPIEAIEFGALGGTNFAKLELLRAAARAQESFDGLAHVGHTALEMVDFVNLVLEKRKSNTCNKFIVSGGIKSFLDGYFLINKIHADANYGMASAFLRHATGDYDELKQFVSSQHKGLALASKLLMIRHDAD